MRYKKIKNIKIRYQNVKGRTRCVEQFSGRYHTIFKKEVLSYNMNSISRTFYSGRTYFLMK